MYATNTIQCLDSDFCIYKVTNLAPLWTGDYPDGFPTIKVGLYNKVHISYWDYGDIKYATNLYSDDISAFKVFTVGKGSYPSMALNPDKITVSISYQVDQQSLKYARGPYLIAW